jgi:hypothetical protein
LTDIRAAVPSLTGLTLSGVSRRLTRAGVRRKRIHSPDPAYCAKRDRIARTLTCARAHPDRLALFYGDEASVYRQPTLAHRWFPVGSEPTSTRSHRADTCHRVCGAVDAVTGRVVVTTGNHIRVPHLQRFLLALRDAEPERSIMLVWDNWPVYRHPLVLAEARRLRIRLRWLPTYAPWLNPIEKL